MNKAERDQISLFEHLEKIDDVRTPVNAQFIEKKQQQKQKLNNIEKFLNQKQKILDDSYYDVDSQ